MFKASQDVVDTCWAGTFLCVCVCVCVCVPRRSSTWCGRRSTSHQTSKRNTHTPSPSPRLVISHQPSTRHTHLTPLPFPHLVSCFTFPLSVSVCACLSFSVDLCIFMFFYIFMCVYVCMCVQLPPVGFVRRTLAYPLLPPLPRHKGRRLS